MNLNSVWTPVGSASLSESFVAGSDTSQVLVRASDHRRGIYFFNHSGASLFLRFGATLAHSASETQFTVKLSSGSYYEMPIPVYTGMIHGVWDVNGDGIVVITSLEAADDSGY